jgi:hypothetical protein
MQETITKKITRTIRLNQQDLENVLRDWLSSNYFENISFAFDFDSRGEIETEIVIVTEEKDEQDGDDYSR